MILVRIYIILCYPKQDFRSCYIRDYNDNLRRGFLPNATLNSIIIIHHLRFAQAMTSDQASRFLEALFGSSNSVVFECLKSNFPIGLVEHAPGRTASYKLSH